LGLLAQGFDVVTGGGPCRIARQALLAGFEELLRPTVIKAIGDAFAAAERRDALLAAQPQERHRLLQSYLSEQVARVLGLSASRLDVHQPLSNLGLDSLMAVELKNRIALDLGVNVPMVKFLQGPSVEEAAAYLFEQLTQGVSDTPAALASAVAQRHGEQKNGRVDEHLLANLDRLSDEEVNSLLTVTLAEEEGGE